MSQGSSLAERAQLASLFGTIGLFAGVLLVGIGALLYTMTQSVREQTATLIELKKSVDHSDDVQKAALSTLLAKEGSTDSPRKFVDTLASAEKDLAIAREEARHAKTAETAQAIRVEAVLADREKLQKEKEAAIEEVAKVKANAESLVEKGNLYDTFMKSEKGEIAQKYNNTWWTAVVGWGLAVLASLMLLAVWASRTEPTPEGPQVPFPNTPPETPHQIV